MSVLLHHGKSSNMIAAISTSYASGKCYMTVFSYYFSKASMATTQTPATLPDVNKIQILLLTQVMLTPHPNPLGQLMLRCLIWWLLLLLLMNWETARSQFDLSVSPNDTLYCIKVVILLYYLLCTISFNFSQKNEITFLRKWVGLHFLMLQSIHSNTST